MTINLKDKKYDRIKCNCGHYRKDHYQGEGFCHHSKHPKAGQCGCTWYWPNDKWVKKQQKKEEKGLTN